MKIKYRNPVADHIAERWAVFEREASNLTSYLNRFGFHMDKIVCHRISSSRSYKFSAILKNSRRIVNLSYISTSHDQGAVSLFIYPIKEDEGKKYKYINLYKYLRKHFGMVNRKYLFLSQYRGDFSQRFQRVVRSYARFSQFYMQSILQGIKWDE